MGSQRQNHQLEVGEDVKFQNRWWVFERIAWVFMALLLLAALLGLLGPGLLSRTRLSDRDSGLSLEFHRFERHQSPAQLKVTISPHALPHPPQLLELQLQRHHLSKIELSRIDPEPEQVAVSSDHAVFSFRTSKSDRPIQITFHFKPSSFGKLTGTFSLPGQPSLPFAQFVYP